MKRFVVVVAKRVHMDLSVEAEDARQAVDKAKDIANSYTAEEWAHSLGFSSEGDWWVERVESDDQSGVSEVVI